MSEISNLLDWDAVIEEIKTASLPLQPEEITHDMLMEKTGMNYDAARNHLKKLVRSGKATKRIIMGHGRPFVAFKLVV